MQIDVLPRDPDDDDTAIPADVLPGNPNSYR